MPMEEQTLLIFAGLFLAVSQVALHYFLKWRLRSDPGIEQTLEAAASPELTRCRRRLATVAKVQSHIGLVFGLWLSLFLAAVSTDSPDHPEYAPVQVGSVAALVSYLLFVERPLQATRQWQRNRTVRGLWPSAANIVLNVWCTPFWVVLPFYIYALVSLLNAVRSHEPSESQKPPSATAHPASQIVEPRD
jgi:hypothetical protein